MKQVRELEVGARMAPTTSIILKTRGLGAPTSCLRPFVPAFGPSGLLEFVLRAGCFDTSGSMIPLLVPEIAACDGFCDQEQQQQELGILVLGWVGRDLLGKERCSQHIEKPNNFVLV